MNLDNAFAEFADEALELSNLHVYAAFEALRKTEEDES